MQPQDFLYFLLNKNGESYYENNGVQSTSTTPKPLDISPDGWQETSIKWERDITHYFSLFRSYSNPLKFVRKAAKTLRTRLYTFGTEDRVNLLILWLDKSFGGGWVHRTFYKGELDLSQFDDKLNYFETNIMEGDLVKLFKANENTEYAIPITGPIVKDDGFLLFQKGNFFVVDGIEFKKTLYPTSFFVPIAYTDSEGQSSGIDFIGQELQDFNAVSFDDKKNSDNFFAAGNANLQVPLIATITGVIKFKCTRNALPFAFNMRFLTSDQTLVTQNAYAIFGLTPVEGQSYSFPVNFSIPVNSATKFHLEGIFAGGVAGSEDNNIKIEFLPDSKLFFSFSNKYKTTYTPTLRLMDVGQALVDFMAGPGYTFQSNHFSTTWNNLVITSGNAIRGIPDSVLKTSFSDFFDSTNVPCNICMDIKNKILSIEPKATAFDPTVVLDLGEAGEFDKSSEKDGQFNALWIGYPNLDTHAYDSLNAKEEFNVISKYTTSVSRVNKALKIVSKYKASMYEQELTRINRADKNSTADSTDDTIFFKLIEKNATVGVDPEPLIYYKLFREIYDSITGLFDPIGAYNIPLSPARCLINHGNYIRSVFYWQAGTSLVFTTSSQNPLLKTVKGAVTVQENANVAIGTLAAPLFIPIDFTVKCPMVRLIVSVMKNTPAGTFSFTWQGDTFYGFVKTVGIQPANRPVQDNLLLCSPQTDILKLIR